MSNPKRERCGNCHFLLTQCVCAFLPSVVTVAKQILVIQDPKEARHAKNTVALLTLVLPQVECVAMTAPDLTQRIQKLTAENWRLIYPSAQSVSVEQVSESEKQEIRGIVLIDATWRKAKRFYLMHPELQQMQSLTFEQAPNEQYAIRKSPRSAYLSTLEACCYAIEQLTQQPMQPVRDFMYESLRWQWRFQPNEHKHNTGI